MVFANLTQLAWHLCYRGSYPTGATNQCTLTAFNSATPERAAIYP